MKLKTVIIIILIPLCGTNLLLNAQGFLHADGKKIVDGSNNEVILKGMGLGGWLVQEGYMLHTGRLDAEHQIRKGIQELVGEEKTGQLYDIYHHNYVRKIDIDSLAVWGFNSIRLPMHWNKLISQVQPLAFNEEGFKTIDTLLIWCESNQMYLILDLHAAPGGQSAGGIADYNPDEPSLWESEENKTLTINLWKEIAARYSEEIWIGGYDLINEPAWELGENAPALRKLYIDITDAIREVDTNHIVFIEGNWWATAFDGLIPPWDDNMVYSFHKYWNQTDQGTIQYLINLRNNTNVPLWLGESGENSNDWFRECVDLMDKNNIGWAWWPHKKIDNISGPLSAPMVNGYQALIDYWNGNGVKPGSDVAYNILRNQFTALRFESCRIQHDVYKSLTQPQSSTSVPYKDHKIPGRIYGTDYDSGGQSIGYSDVDYKNTGSGSYNLGYAYRNDGVDIELCEDSNTNGFNVGWIETGEWLEFSCYVDETATYNLEMRTSAQSSGGKILFAIDGVNFTEFIDVPLTNGWQNWISTNLGDHNLSAGEHKIRVKFYIGGFNFNYFEFTKTVVGINESPSLPEEFELFQNYPNPFNPITTIKYALSGSDIRTEIPVTLKLYDVLGNEIKTLVNELQAPGIYKIEFNGIELSSGVYYYRLDAGYLSQTKKLVILK
jgi:endoglucanase